MTMRSSRCDGRGHWPRGKSRSDVDRSVAVPFVAALISASGMSLAALARRSGVSRKTIWSWMTGRKVPTLASLVRLIDAALPMHRGWMPLYGPDMAIDGHTRAGGVGEYSRMAARGGGDD